MSLASRENIKYGKSSLVPRPFYTPSSVKQSKTGGVEGLGIRPGLRLRDTRARALRNMYT